MSDDEYERRAKEREGHACAHVREISRSRAMDSVMRAATRVSHAGMHSVQKLLNYLLKSEGDRIRERWIQKSEFAN